MNTDVVADALSAEVVTANVAAIGQHVLADLYGIAPALLRDAAQLAAVLRAAAEAAGAHLLASHFHTFGTDDGVTGVVLLAESHISIHTWPEFGFAAADIFMCGHCEPARALAALVAALAPLRQEVRTAARGPRPGF